MLEKSTRKLDRAVEWSSTSAATGGMPLSKLLGNAQHLSAVENAARLTGALSAHESILARAAPMANLVPKEPVYLKNLSALQSLLVQPTFLPNVNQIAAAYRPEYVKTLDTFQSTALRSSASDLLRSIDKVIAPRLAAFDKASGLATTLGSVSQALAALPSFDTQAWQLAAGSEAIAGILPTFESKLASSGLLAGVTAYAGTQSVIAGSEIWGLLRGATVSSSRQLDTYLGSLGARPTSRRATLAGLAGHGVSGLMATEALLMPGLDGDELDALEYEFATTTLEPWQSAPTRAREDLYGELARIDPALADLLKGAWEDIDRDGPAAVAKAAHCLQEVVDWTLRHLARDEETHEFLAASALTGARYLSDGKLTRAARVSFIVQSRSRGDRSMIRKYGDCLGSMLSELTAAVQGRKHGGQVVTVSASGIRAQALAVESWLTMLLFGPR